MKIGFIGIGNMGSALAQAVAKLEGMELWFSNHNPTKADQLKGVLGGKLASNQEIASQADIIFLGVKPYLIEQVVQDIAEDANQEAIWISMAAGVTLDKLSTSLSPQRIVRIMPNTPVAIGQGMTTYSLFNPELAPLVEELLVHSGQVLQVPEGQIDAATAIAGCGPAFVYQMVEALTDAGIAQGLKASDAQFLAAQTLVGTAQMVLESSKDPAQLRKEVTSPGGSTIAGVVALEQAGFRSALIEAVQAATNRTKELGE